MHNDALKNNVGEAYNEVWSQLLRELNFYDEDIDDHILFLRRKFVLGAAEWMAGKNGSKQNDKVLLDYSDEEWEYIWMTMLEDGAWAVPGIKNIEGNIVKQNDAPEILIRYIAHELKCHIIVFDLVLNRVQFLSGNHVKTDNVMFESPLLLYSSGSHFQSVFQVDHEHFVQYAKELDAENDTVQSPAQSIQIVERQDQDGIPQMTVYTNKPKVIQRKNCKDDLQTKSNDLKPNPNRKRKTVEENSSEVSNVFSVLSESDPAENDNGEDIESIKNIKLIKAKLRTPEQKLLLKQFQNRNRKKENQETQKRRQEKDREHRKSMREGETDQVRKARQEKDREHKKSMREGETADIRKARLEKKKEHMRLEREGETADIRKARLEKKRST